MRQVLSDGVRGFARCLSAKDGVTPDQIIELWRRLGYSIKRESSLMTLMRPSAPPYIAFGATFYEATDRTPETLIAFIVHTLHRKGYACACTEQLDHGKRSARCRLVITGHRPVTCRTVSTESVEEARFSAALQAFLQMLVLLPDEETLPRAA